MNEYKATPPIATAVPIPVWVEILLPASREIIVRNLMASTYTSSYDEETELVYELGELLYSPRKKNCTFGENICRQTYRKRWWRIQSQTLASRRCQQRGWEVPPFLRCCLQAARHQKQIKFPKILYQETTKKQIVHDIQCSTGMLL